MSSPSMSDIKITTKELLQLSLICALMFICKEAMNALPNIHPVMLFIILTGIVYGWKALLPVFGFSLLEIAVFGLGMWSIVYLYIWPLALCLVMAFRNNRSALVWSVLAAAFGLCFGMLSAIPYIFVSGFKGAAAYWIAGIPFDLLHAAGNFVITLVLYPVLLPVFIGFKDGSIFLSK